MSPDARETIGLQLHPYLDAIRLDTAAGRPLSGLRFRQHSDQVLYVVSDFVRDHISLGEVASLATKAAEASADVAEERGIKINAPVVRTIKRSHCRLCETATALHRARIQPQPWHAVLLAGAFKNFSPCIFGIAEHGRDEIAHLVLRRAGTLRRLLIGLLIVSSAVDEFGASDQHARIDTERPTDQTKHDDGSNADTAAPDRNTNAAATEAAAIVAAAILDVVAATEIIPTHREFLLHFAQSSPNCARTSNAGLASAPSPNL